jgi:hypothetical protein
MTNSFAGTALPLDQDGLAQVVDTLDTGQAELWAVLTVETAGCGYTRDRQPRILFERHKFSQATGGRFDVDYPDISNPVAGGYGSLDAQYDRLQRAIALNRAAALDSASWGIGQIMGYNAPAAGYASSKDMVAAMMASEANQLLAMAHFLQDKALVAPLRRHDWAAFARGYNGAAYAKNQYDKRLNAAFHKYTAGPLPDLRTRAVQMLLTYLGYSPGAIDGLAGKLTYAALTDFRQKQSSPASDAIDDAVVGALLERVRQLGMAQDG